MMKFATKACFVCVGIIWLVGPALGQSFEAGKAAFVTKDFTESIKQFKLATEANPSQHVIWANLGRPTLPTSSTTKR